MQQTTSEREPTCANLTGCLVPSQARETKKGMYHVTVHQYNTRYLVAYCTTNVLRHRISTKHKKYWLIPGTTNDKATRINHHVV